MRILFLLACVGLLGVSVVAQRDDFSVFDAKGGPADIDGLVNRLDSVDVLFLGESHDDAVGHRLQLEIFRSALKRYGDSRSLFLSLEMFERDVQNTLDEYLADLISEKHFVEASRPWKNYESDYRPLVELAKQAGVPVIAANAPRRYVNMVSRLGRDSLLKLPAGSKKWLAPLPYAEASKEYIAKFNALMGSMGDNPSAASHNPIIHSQTLWDATMAYSIAEALSNSDSPLVIHLNGSFHTENRLGIPDHLAKYKKGARYLVVTMRYEEDFKSFKKDKHMDLGDYVVLTDAAVPRSGK